MLVVAMLITSLLSKPQLRMLHSVFLLIGFGYVLVMANDDGCNEMVCGSVVSKCLLTQSCQCKLSDCHCCKDCLNCLGELYTECCGCLDMCPNHKDVQNSMTPRSEIGDFDGVPELFDTLTSEEDDQWTIHISKHDGFVQRLDTDADVSNMAEYDPSGNPNCTVIYVNLCLRSLKCKQHCESMGANSYRWFHNGCCECVGDRCMNYGINESRCTSCPDDQDLGTDEAANIDNESDMKSLFGFKDDSLNYMWDYGEDDDMM